MGVVVIVGAVLVFVRPFPPDDEASVDPATPRPSPHVQSLAPGGSISPVAPVVHVVVSGDTLRSIAERYLGDEAQWRRVYEANLDVIADPERLVVGQSLKIPPR